MKVKSSVFHSTSATNDAAIISIGDLGIIKLGKMLLFCVARFKPRLMSKHLGLDHRDSSKIWGK
jgi:hypothetical protein